MMVYMRKIGLVLSAFLIVFLLSFRTVGAEVDKTIVENKEVDSYVLFWPLVAGRTIDDSLYPLKMLKEKVRGFLIFGRPQKAENQLFLTTKRVLETEALVKSGKIDLAIKTLSKAESLINEAANNLSAASLSDVNLDETRKKLENLDQFLGWYGNKVGGELKSKVDTIHTQVTLLLTKVGS